MKQLQYKDKKPIGGGAIRAYDEERVELKRIFIIPEAQGKGVGTELVENLIKWGRELGYKSIILETGKILAESCHVYKKLGFEEIPNYGPYINVPESLYMSKKL